jgi:hypothetical protein
MARLWSMYCDWRQDGYCHCPDPNLVCVRLLSHHGISSDYLFRACFLDEYETLYPIRQEKSVEILMSFGSSRNVFCFSDLLFFQY